MGLNWWILPAAISLLWTLGGIIAQQLVVGNNLISQPLQDDGLAQRVYKLADTAGFPLIELHETSKSLDFSDKPLFLAPVRKTHRVFFTPFILEKLSPSQLEVVFAHELGHLKANHFKKKGAIKATILVSRWFLTAMLLQFVLGAHASAFLVLAGVSGIHLICGLIEPLLEAIYSRHCEKQADLYALELTGDAVSFQSAFRILIEHLPGGRLDSFLIRVYATHPSLHRRLGFAQDWSKSRDKTNLGTSDEVQSNFEPA